MLNFEWLWMLIFLPLPLLVRWKVKPVEVENSARLKVPFIEEFQQESSHLMRIKQNVFLLILAYIAWICLIIAAAKPQWVGDIIELPIQGRDIMMAVDLSGSMKERDFRLNGRYVNRLIATKAVASQFIDKRHGDRIGLILFGTQAYLQAPLTFDRTTVSTLLLEAQIGLAGEKTAIGDAITLSVKRLSAKQELQPILILLTDGANTAGQIEPKKAAELARSKGIKIYTIGMGSQRGWNDLDESTLKTIAEQTGGRYFKAKNTQQLSEIYQLVDQLEQSDHDGQRYRPTKSLFMWPLSLSLLLSASVIAMRLRMSS
ncbi:MAG: VWA domain-containing protein [Methylococcales bacterium]|jgi:Ca-activated chloride channel homolog|nr:VWA domain-containing protein [Methylococcales bacterium]MBT7445797.1 VWA domain-containing protein [Methylococcales bacterium]